MERSVKGWLLLVFHVGDQGVVEKAIAGNQFFATSGCGPPFAVGHLTAGFLDDQRTCGHIPGVELQFPVGIESPGRDITQIQRCTAIPPLLYTKSRSF